MKAAVFYFSGTGNTELVAKILHEGLTQRQYATDLIRIEDVLKKKVTVDVSQYDLIGIGSQVIGFAAPSLVYRFIRSLPKMKGKKTFVFRTAGGVAPVNYNASKPMIRRLKRKGYDVFYERIFSISSNWITRFDGDVIIKLHEATRKKTGLMCEEIMRGEKRVLRTGLIQKILMECVMAVTPLFFRLVGKDYVVSVSCTHCGLCIKNCPAGNIIEKDGKIKFNFSCNTCMRCVYSCPNNAIKHKKFSSFAVSGGYNISKILAQPAANADKDKKPAPRFFENYLANDNL
jgi:flavodoxin/ferredoxin